MNKNQSLDVCISLASVRRQACITGALLDRARGELGAQRWEWLFLFRLNKALKEMP